MNITVERPPWKIDDFTIDDVIGKGDDKLHVILLNAYKTDTINYIERLEGYGLPKPERVPDYISTVLFHNNPDVNFSMGGDFKLIDFASISTKFQHYRRARMDFHERSNSHYATLSISENSYHDNRFPEYVMPVQASMPFPRTIANQHVLNGFKLMNKGLHEIDAAETTEAEKEGRKKLVAGSHVLRYSFYELFTEDDYSMFSKLRARDVFPEHAKLPIYDFYDSELNYLAGEGILEQLGTYLVGSETDIERNMTNLGYSAHQFGEISTSLFMLKGVLDADKFGLKESLLFASGLALGADCVYRSINAKHNSMPPGIFRKIHDIL